jgi:hypothetical protein
MLARGDPSACVEDPGGNVVAMCDVFNRGDGARERVEALP